MPLSDPPYHPFHAGVTTCPLTAQGRPLRRFMSSLSVRTAPEIVASGPLSSGHSANTAQSLCESRRTWPAGQGPRVTTTPGAWPAACTHTMQLTPGAT